MLEFSSLFYCTRANCSSYAFSEMIRCSLKYLYSSCLELKEHEISIMILVPKANSLHSLQHSFDNYLKSRDEVNSRVYLVKTKASLWLRGRETALVDSITEHDVQV